MAAGQVHALVDLADAQTVINTLFERSYRAVHIAGHGAVGASGGVVLSEANTFLGASEVRAMRTVPEVVFLNCCHLAERDANTTLAPYDRSAFAANIAEELIRVGVRCVVAAGWAVEDGPAEQFATRFYAELLAGARFIEAVGAAREAAWNANPNGNTWAAYQCYGDPEWTWLREGSAPRAARPPTEQFAGVASPVSLSLALETLAIAAQFGNATAQRLGDQLRYLEGEFASLWGEMGAVAEAFGVAHAALGALDDAIRWQRVALHAADGSASLRAAEQLGNLLVRRAEQRAAAGAPGDLAAARTDIEAGIAHLQRLAALQPSVERASLLGSAHKRLCLLETRAGRDKAAAAALEATVSHYRAAEALARETGSTTLFYPAMNALGAELRAALLARRPVVFAADRIAAVSESLHWTAAAEPDFWSVVGLSELSVLTAVAQRQLAAVVGAVTAHLRDLKARVPAPLQWDSVWNEARFTLEPYVAVAGPAERRAAQALLAVLESLARP
jgi:tetratricopeptide (TPR) repeat protein